MPITHTAITQRYRKPLDVFLHIKGLCFTDSLCYFHLLLLKSEIAFQAKVVRLADRSETTLLRLFFKLLQCEKSFFRMAPMEDRVYHMDAAFGEISNIDAAAVLQQISDIQDRRGTMEDFLRILKQQDGEVTTFSEKRWCDLLDYAVAYADGRLMFTFKNGSTFEG